MGKMKGKSNQIKSKWQTTTNFMQTKNGMRHIVHTSLDALSFCYANNLSLVLSLTMVSAWNGLPFRNWIAYKMRSTSIVTYSGERSEKTRWHIVENMKRFSHEKHYNLLVDVHSISDIQTSWKSSIRLKINSPNDFNLTKQNANSFFLSLFSFFSFR